MKRDRKEPADRPAGRRTEARGGTGSESGRKRSKGKVTSTTIRLKSPFVALSEFAARAIKPHTRLMLRRRRRRRITLAENRKGCQETTGKVALLGRTETE